MPFLFLKYIRPIWYFHESDEKLASGSDFFVDPSSLEVSTQQLLVPGEFNSEEAKKADLAYQALLTGVMPKGKKPLILSEGIIRDVRDNYLFVQRNFSSSWTFIILFLRLITFKAPWKEIPAFLSVRSKARIPKNRPVLSYPEFDSFQSPLIASNPLVTVVIPTLNRYEYLKPVLEDLERQSYTHFEVLVMDQSDSFQSTFYEGWKLNLKAAHLSQKGLWNARNKAIAEANGSYIALTEDDVRIPAEWLENHLKALDFFKMDISSGVFFPSGSEIPIYRKHFQVAEQFATGNVVLPRRIFVEMGSFDMQFEKQRMGDGEYGLRCVRKGYSIISNPISWCEDVKAPAGGLREMGSWDSFRPKSLLSPRPIPSVVYLFRKYYGTRRALFAIIMGVLPSLIPYKYKRNKALLPIGLLLTVVLMPLVIYQVSKSWNLGSKMLKVGAKISPVLPN